LILCSGKVKGIFKVYTFHSPWQREYEIENEGKGFLSAAGSALRKKIEKFCLERCDRIIVLSEYMKGELLRIHRINADKVRVVPGGVDAEKFIPALSKPEVRDKLSLPRDKFVMLSVRRLVKRTGLVELVVAAASLLKRGRDFVLVIAGEGPRRKEIEDLIEKLNLRSKVILTGFIGEESLPLYYQASDLFVMPTQKLEGFGLAALEALSSGLPVLATPVGGIPEVLSGLDLSCFSEGLSPQSLAEGLNRFIGDREKMSAIAGKARAYAAEKFSWEKIIPELEKAFMR